VPAAVWSDPATLQDAMTEIEMANMDFLAIDFTISNMVWLNSQEVHNKSGRGLLMLSFKTKNATNAAIDLNLAVCGVTCSVSLNIPWLPQCYWCQDWGHRVTECTGEECCGCCIGSHATSQHTCLHDNPCPASERCIREPAMCANCCGDHASWIHNCPISKAALAAQAK